MQNGGGSSMLSIDAIHEFMLQRSSGVLQCILGSLQSKILRCGILGYSNTHLFSAHVHTKEIFLPICIIIQVSIVFHLLVPSLFMRSIFIWMVPFNFHHGLYTFFLCPLFLSFSATLFRQNSVLTIGFSLSRLEESYTLEFSYCFNRYMILHCEHITASTDIHFHSPKSLFCLLLFPIPYVTLSPIVLKNLIFLPFQTTFFKRKWFRRLGACYPLEILFLISASLIYFF